MNIYWVNSKGIESQPLKELEALLKKEGGFIWVDIPECDKVASQVLSRVFCFHPMAVRDCIEPRHMPKIHAYADHVFLVLHNPEVKGTGEVHRFEINQFIGRRFLVTVHENSDRGVPLDNALRETQLVYTRIQTGRFTPASPAELSYAVVSAMTRHMESAVSNLAKRISDLEHKIMSGQVGNPDPVLEEIFRLRHELLTIRTIAAQDREMYLRMSSFNTRHVPPDDRPYLDDIINQLERIQSLCDEEKEFLQGVLDFFQTRTASRTQGVMQRIAIITALTLPVTAVASIYGMNMIVNSQTELPQLLGAFILMGLLITGMLWWSHKQGWW